MDCFDKDGLIRARDEINKIYIFQYPNKASRRAKAILRRIDKLIAMADRDVKRRGEQYYGH